MNEINIFRITYLLTFLIVGGFIVYLAIDISNRNKKCPDNCSNNGTCNEKGQCICNAGWTSYNCGVSLESQNVINIVLLVFVCIVFVVNTVYFLYNNYKFTKFMKNKYR